MAPSMLPKLVVPQVHIPLLLWQQMMAYVLACPVEVHGFGIVNFDPEDRTLIHLDEVFIVDQLATDNRVVADQAALGRFMHQMQLRGGDPGQIKFQWHSHVNMPAFFSVTDRMNIEGWMGDWFISMVLNRFGEFECRYDVLRPIRSGCPVEPIIGVDIPRDITEQAAREVADRVKSPKRFFSGPRPIMDGTPPASTTHVLPQGALRVKGA